MDDIIVLRFTNNIVSDQVRGFNEREAIIKKALNLFFICTLFIVIKKTVFDPSTCQSSSSILSLDIRRCKIKLFFFLTKNRS